jgi:DNA-binding response OmpR family regulator
MNGTVLIVDDSLTVRMHLAEILEAAGFRTVVCATGAEARQQLAERQFPLVVLDILLPDADGVELLAEIRASPFASGTAVMLLSTEAEVRDRIRGLTTGADEYIGKPYEPGYLVARARELVRRHETPEAADATTILLIDDSITFREALKDALEAERYRVLVAGTGEDGLRIAADMRPSAVVVDGMLPGVDGATVIRRIRLDAALRHLPCLLLTASEDHRAEIRALDAGADAFVRKDEDRAVILARLNAMLRSAHAQGGDRRTASLLAPKKILAVDDSETFLQELAGALREDGYDVALAHSGEEAIELLSIQAVDCILLDVLMPGIGGQETCRRLKAVPVTRDIPVVMLTAIEDRNAMILGFGAGADDYIAKSSDFEVLRARVLAQIRRKQFEDENRHIREQLLQRELEAADARAARAVAEARAALVEELELKNEELESFSYSVAHDLRAPLRRIDGFSAALLEDYADRLDDDGKDHLRRVRESANRMGDLIDDLLRLSRITRQDFQRQQVDLTAIARDVLARLRSAHPERTVDFVAADGIVATGDGKLLTVALENLLGNAWKFTGKCERARIEFFATVGEGHRTYAVRDNGAGFDMAQASKLFGVFQRLHAQEDFDGTGVGLATVQRVVRRHGGRIWAEGKPGHGATFYFRLDGGPAAPREDGAIAR